MNRPDWNEYFMEFANLAKRRSTCLRRQVGAVIVKDKRVVSTGYNGAPSGLDHCDLHATLCLRTQFNIPSGQKHELCRGVHAEQNAIIQAARYGVSIFGGSLYCTHMPCSICLKMLINVGIAEIFYSKKYDDSISIGLIKKSKIKIQRILV